jgi:hypothetical protein
MATGLMVLRQGTGSGIRRQKLGVGAVPLIHGRESGSVRTGVQAR